MDTYLQISLLLYALLRLPLMCVLAVSVTVRHRSTERRRTRATFKNSKAGGYMFNLSEIQVITRLSASLHVLDMEKRYGINHLPHSDIQRAG
jgi:hypothetical protein